MANMNWLRLPAELRSRRQWAVSTLAPLVNPDGSPVMDPKTGKQKVDKSPRNISGYNIDLTNPGSFHTFADVANAGFPAIGYILTADDPFTIIDLDHSDDPVIIDRQRKVFGAFYTYAEASQSGLGSHIILNGRIGGGVRRDNIEVYDQDRYMICTGQIQRDAPISAGGETLDRLVYEMGGVNPEQEMPDDQPARLTDLELYNVAMAARNGERFKDLYHRVPVAGEDWSHRDASLAQILAFYTRNHDQLLRMFRGSALYRPHDKGKNPHHYETYYLARTFARAIRAEMARDADVDAGRALAQQLIAANNQPSPSGHGDTGAGDAGYPAGLVGDVARYIYGAAPRPVHEIALAGALALVAGLVGRHYNIQGSGLNLYVVLLAHTGRGKEAAPDGIEAIVEAVSKSMPNIQGFMGPGAFASGQGLTRALDKSPCMLSMLGEFGHLLRRVTDHRASPADVAMRQMLLALFSKSGKGKTLRGTAYSDVEKNTKDIVSPSLTFLGDTTPEAYYSCFTSGLVGEGLIPRFLSITYDGPRVATNLARMTAVPQPLIDRLASLVSSVLNMMQSNTFAEVIMTSAAQAKDNEFDALCDAKINEAGSDGMAEVWNRAHLKVRRVAAVIAVGKNHMSPVIEMDDYLWAERLVRQDIETITHRVATGDVGEGESRRAPEVERAIKDYVVMPKEKKVKTYMVQAAIVDHPHLIPYTYFRRRFKNHSSFANHPRGLVAAIKDALQDAMDLGILQKMGNDQKLQYKGLRADTEVFVVSKPE